MSVSSKKLTYMFSMQLLENMGCNNNPFKLLKVATEASSSQLLAFIMEKCLQDVILQPNYQN